MSHILQVGAGSGGIVVLDLLARDPAVTRITLVEPDVYSAHNVHRHLFPPSAVGRRKAELAREWVHALRPDIAFEAIIADITDPAQQATYSQIAESCDVGVCAVDSEPAKYAFDALMRKARKPWTLGEVLSGGIGGWVHCLVPDGPCYGCVASYLQRSVTDAPPAPAPDYSHPDGPVTETTIPASKASISTIASLHATVTLKLLKHDDHEPREEVSTSMLFTLARVPGVFDEAYRMYRFNIPRSSACLICSTPVTESSEERLDVAVDQALGRLAPQ